MATPFHGLRPFQVSGLTFNGSKFNESSIENRQSKIVNSLLAYASVVYLVFVEIP